MVMAGVRNIDQRLYIHTCNKEMSGQYASPLVCLDILPLCCGESRTKGTRLRQYCPWLIKDMFLLVAVSHPRFSLWRSFRESKANLAESQTIEPRGMFKFGE